MSKRQNGEGSWDKVKIGKYDYYRLRITINGARKTFQGKTQADVKKKYKQYIENNKNVVSTDYANMSLGDYLKYWLDYKKQFIKPTTYEAYETVVYKRIIDFPDNNIANQSIANLTVDEFQDYFKELAKIYSRASIKKVYTVIYQALEYGCTKNHIKYNVLNTKLNLIASEETVAVKKKEIQFLEEADMKKLVFESHRQSANGQLLYGNNGLAIVFIMHTGLRVGELIALKWKNVDLDNKVIYIKEGSIVVTENIDGNKIRIKKDTTPKTKTSERMVYLSTTAYNILKDLNNQHPNHKNIDYVFLTRNKTPMNRDNLRRTLNKMLKRADCSVQQCGLHVLRHTFGSALIRKGEYIGIVSELLGHANTKTTENIYIHLIQEQKRKAITCSLD